MVQATASYQEQQQQLLYLYLPLELQMQDYIVIKYEKRGPIKSGIRKNTE
jgi:hypothetical protein